MAPTEVDGMPPLINVDILKNDFSVNFAFTATVNKFKKKI